MYVYPNQMIAAEEGREGTASLCNQKPLIPVLRFHLSKTIRKYLPYIFRRDTIFMDNKMPTRKAVALQHKIIKIRSWFYNIEFLMTDTTERT
jgi:hypothetical protein